jgi:hypothetical protein
MMRVIVNGVPRQEPLPVVVNFAASGSLSAANMAGNVIGNVGQTGDVAVTLAPAFQGGHFTVALGVAVAKYFRLIPATGDTIALDGSTTGANKYVGIASVTKYAEIRFCAVQTGAATWEWSAVTVLGTFAQEAA